MTDERMHHIGELLTDASAMNEEFVASLPSFMGIERLEKAMIEWQASGRPLYRDGFQPPVPAPSEENRKRWSAWLHSADCPSAVRKAYHFEDSD